MKDKTQMVDIQPGFPALWEDKTTGQDWAGFVGLAGEEWRAVMAIQGGG